MKIIRNALPAFVALCLGSALLVAPAASADVNAKDACNQYRDANQKANARWIEFKDGHEDDDSKQYWHDVAADLNEAALAVNDLAKDKGYGDNIQNAFVSYAHSMRELAEAVNRQEQYDRLQRPLSSVQKAQQDVQSACKQYWG
jgi:gas vesicle protein